MDVKRAAFEKEYGTIDTYSKEEEDWYLTKLGSWIIAWESAMEYFGNSHFEIDASSWFYKNCRQQRKRGAKICETCPFRAYIESMEKATDDNNGRKLCRQ